ncbi:hypothetical protein Glove_296g65 [Diversispora epigaea]|uniref:Uncharacterized protein n=1 Tax=Diversispora epigaea TaxID=1348612 RepID=A0A397I340_9GLOM|nr:hypothetical protein Glove_296g65 [Diversispora epigaea]
MYFRNGPNPHVTLDKVRPTTVIFHLLARYGPMSGKQLASYMPHFPQFKSKNYLKRDILKNMKNRDHLYKRKSGNVELTKLAQGESSYLWFINEETIDKEKYLNIHCLKDWDPNKKSTTSTTTDTSNITDKISSMRRKEKEGQKKQQDFDDDDDYYYDDDDEYVAEDNQKKNIKESKYNKESINNKESKYNRESINNRESKHNREPMNIDSNKYDKGTDYFKNSQKSQNNRQNKKKQDLYDDGDDDDEYVTKDDQKKYIKESKYFRESADINSDKYDKYQGFDYYKKSQDDRWKKKQMLHWELPETVKNIIQQEKQEKIYERMIEDKRDKRELMNRNRDRKYDYNVNDINKIKIHHKDPKLAAFFRLTKYR